VLWPSEGGVGGQDAPDGFPASGRNAYLSEANPFFPDVQWEDPRWDNSCGLSLVTWLLCGISFPRFTSNCIVSLFTQTRGLYEGMSWAGKGCARISFNIKGASPPISFHLSRPLHLQRLKSQHHGKSS